MGVARPSPVISLKGSCNPLQGEVGVIQGVSGAQGSRTCAVPSSPGGLMNRGLRPRRRAILTADMGTNLKVHGWLIQQLSTTLV